MLALSVAGVLALFLVYVSFAGGGTPSVQPSELKGRSGEVSLAGMVVGKPSGDSFAGGLRFRLRDVEGKATVPVVYRGTVPDLFGVGKHVLVQGRLANGVFVAKRDSMITKCPSKYVAKKSA